MHKRTHHRIAKKLHRAAKRHTRIARRKKR